MSWKERVDSILRHPKYFNAMETFLMKKLERCFKSRGFCFRYWTPYCMQGITTNSMCRHEMNINAQMVMKARFDSRKKY